MPANFGGQILEFLLWPAMGIAAIIILLVIIVGIGVQFIKNRHSENN